MSADDLFGGAHQVIAALMEGRHSPAAARDAATVLLLRAGDGRAGGEGGDGAARGDIEVFLLRRTAAMAFAAGMYVFPGGSVDPEDREITWSGPDPAHWGEALAAEAPLARALAAAAVRETFEECGVLLAERAADPTGGGSPEGPDMTEAHWESARTDLEQRRTSLARVLRTSGLRLRADLLAPWGHWITPEVEPRRFDTRFFLAVLPEGQVPRSVSGESEASVWLRPQDALDAAAAGSLAMMPPTLAVLRELADCAAGRTPAEVLAAARDRRVTHILPRVVLREGHVAMLLPGDVGYDSAYPPAPTSAPAPDPAAAPRAGS